MQCVICPLPMNVWSVQILAQNDTRFLAPPRKKISKIKLQPKKWVPIHDLISPQPVIPSDLDKRNMAFGMRSKHGTGNSVYEPANPGSKRNVSLSERYPSSINLRLMMELGRNILMLFVPTLHL
eukprot:217_1